MTAPDPKLIGMYDQYKTEFNETITAMADRWRAGHDAGKSDFDIFGAHLAGIDRAQPSFERVAVMVALMTERLAEAQRREELMRPVVEAARAVAHGWRDAAGLFARDSDDCQRFLAAVDTYETQTGGPSDAGLPADGEERK